MNVSCNIFINSFGSIAETTMVSKSKHKLLFPVGHLSLLEIVPLCIGLPKEVRDLVCLLVSGSIVTEHFYCPIPCFR